MAIELQPTMTTTFSEIFSQWRLYPSPFFRKNGGGLQQAWLRMNLLTRHVDVAYTAHAEGMGVRFLPGSGVLAIPLPRYLTGVQMHRLLNSSSGLMQSRESEMLKICHHENQDYVRENIHEALRFALDQEMISTRDGRFHLKDEARALGLLGNVQLWLEDLASLNEVVYADECSLSQIGLSGADDDGWQRKSMAHVTQVSIKGTDTRLTDSDDLAELIRQLSGKSGVVYVGLRERLIRLARLTRSTMHRLGITTNKLHVMTRPIEPQGTQESQSQASTRSMEAPGGTQVTAEPSAAGRPALAAATRACRTTRQNHAQTIKQGGMHATFGSAGNSTLPVAPRQKAQEETPLAHPLASGRTTLRRGCWRSDLAWNRLAPNRGARHRGLGNALPLDSPPSKLRIPSPGEKGGRKPFRPAQSSSADRNGAAQSAADRQDHWRNFICSNQPTSSWPWQYCSTQSRSASISGMKSSWHGLGRAAGRSLVYVEVKPENGQVDHVSRCRTPSHADRLDYHRLFGALRSLVGGANPRAPPAHKKKVEVLTQEMWLDNLFTSWNPPGSS